jgi:hypothetical protein
MSIEAIAAERFWFAIAPDGGEHSVALRIGLPQQQPQGAWAVNVAIVPIDRSPHSIVGIDSWQAIDEGMLHLGLMVKHYQSLGWRFFWERGGKEASPADLGRTAVENP